MKNKVKVNIDELLTEEEKKVLDRWKEAQKYAKVAEKEIAFNDDYEKAAEYLTKAIELDSRNFLYYEGRAHCYRRLNKNDKEIRDIDKAIELSPREDRLYLDKSRHYLCIGKYDNALDEVNKSIEILYDNISFYYTIIAEIYESMKDYEKSLKYYNEALHFSKFYYENIEANKKRIKEKLNKTKEK